VTPINKLDPFAFFKVPEKKAGGKSFRVVQDIRMSLPCLLYSCFRLLLHEMKYVSIN
jgi:hypothetical protein